MTAISSDRSAFPSSVGGAAHSLRSSQSAFFRAALGVSEPVGTAAAKPVAAPVVQATQVKAVDETMAPRRYTRPGSLVDIRV